MKFLSKIICLTLLCSCQKDFTCVCEVKTLTEPIYYNNKIETEATSSSTFNYETLNGKEKAVNKECNQTSKHSEANTSLPEGRTGGAITHETNCFIQE